MFTVTRKGHRSVAVFVIFAAGYLLSSLLRGVTAALAPLFTAEFAITPAQLGLLAGSYFASFAVMQLPMGALLDRFGVRAVLTASLSLAALSCIVFAAAESLIGLLNARLLTGIGVSACLIAPLTAARLWTTPALQQRLNSWMLMAGALGLVLGTLPSESLATNFGWPTLFVALGALFAIVALLVAAWVPKQPSAKPVGTVNLINSYAVIIGKASTWRVGALGFFNYAILVAIQTLWIGPWLTTIGGESTREASLNLLFINTIMLLVFLMMGYFSPRFIKSADDSDALLRRWTPLSVSLLIFIAALGSKAPWSVFALYCMAAWPLSVTHPLVGQRSDPSHAGRAIAFFNLLLFVGVFFWQWGFGALVLVLTPRIGIEPAFQIAMGALAVFSGIGYAIFMTGTKPSGALPLVRAPQQKAES